MMGGLLSWRIAIALVWMFPELWVLGAGVLLGVVVVAKCLVVFLRRVIRLICLVSDLVIMDGCSLVFCALMWGCAIGTIFCESRWYLSIVLITRFAAL